jgi:hypothetical protein
MQRYDNDNFFVNFVYQDKYTLGRQISRANFPNTSKGIDLFDSINRVSRNRLKIKKSSSIKILRHTYVHPNHELDSNGCQVPYDLHLKVIELFGLGCCDVHQFGYTHIPKEEVVKCYTLSEDRHMMESKRFWMKKLQNSS